MRHVIPISGKDSCATALVQMARRPDLPYELFFSDTGTELPETYAWLNKVEKKLNRKVMRVGRSLEEVIFKHGILPSPKVRFCTREAKIEPMEEWLGEDLATVYFGIRADEQRRGGYVPNSKARIIPSYPLKETGVTLPMVYLILDKQGLKPPAFFWRRLYDEVMRRLGKKIGLGLVNQMALKKLEAIGRGWEFDQLFAWRSRSNCFHCFFQRLYEWVGLLEHHPKLFDRAEEIERTKGSQRWPGQEDSQTYTWIHNYPLSRVREEKERVFKKRVLQVIRALCSSPSRRPFSKREPLDLLEVTSCGLFCGK